MALARGQLPMNAGVIWLGFVGIVSDDPAVRACYRDAIGQTAPEGRWPGTLLSAAPEVTGCLEALQSFERSCADCIGGIASHQL